MTIEDVLTEVDELRPNTFDDAMKIRWISILEGRIVDEVLSTHILADKIEFTGYTLNDMAAELFVPDQYADVYKFYIFAMMDSVNGETARYTVSQAQFNDAWKSFANFYNRTNMPLSYALRVF